MHPEIRAELAHRARIIADEPELCADYGVTRADARAFEDAMLTGQPIADRFLRVAIAELENAREHAAINLDSVTPEEIAQVRTWHRTIRAALRDLRVREG